MTPRFNGSHGSSALHCLRQAVGYPQLMMFRQVLIRQGRIVTCRRAPASDGRQVTPRPPRRARQDLTQLRTIAVGRIEDSYLSWVAHRSGPVEEPLFCIPL